MVKSATREFFTVDLRGLRAALKGRAGERSVTESDILRSALAAALEVNGSVPVTLPPVPERPPTTTQVKLSVRLPRLAAHHLNINARSTGLSRGAYLTRLVEGAPAVTPAKHHGEQIAALAASTDELALLSRDVNDLVRLLKQGQVRAAQEYRGRLQTLDVDVQKHIERASITLAELRSRRPGSGSTRAQ